MNKQNRILSATGGLLAIGLALVLIGPLPAGEDDSKAEKAIKALGGNVVRLLGAPGRPIISVEFINSNLTDAGLKELAGLKSLEILNLFGTKVTDAGLKELANLKSLRTLYLFNSQVTNAAVVELRKALPKCTISR